MSALPKERDTRIDFIRGVFILMMVADHFGYLLSLIGSNAQAKVYTYNSIGWSSGAEFFVFFSGYVIATVYSKTMNEAGFWKAQLRSTHRAWELYARNALVFMLALAMMRWLFDGNTALYAATQLDRAARLPDNGILAFMSLQYAPTYLEVLPLYMQLLLFTPIFLWLHARSRVASIVLSALLWLLVQLKAPLGLDVLAVRGTFNPWAWQFLFFLGMWFAKECPLTTFDRSHAQLKVAVLLGVLALCTVVKLIDKSNLVLPVLGAIDVPGHAKPDLEPLRLAHFLLVVYLIGVVLPANDWVKQRLLTRGIAQVGTHSLDCFCFSILLNYATAGLFSMTPRGTLEYFVLQLVNVGGVVAAAFFFSWLKTPPWRPQPVPRPAPADPAWAGPQNMDRAGT